MAFDAAGDLLVTDGSADTFELPNPKPSTFPMVGGGQGMAINARDNHWFIADFYDGAAEYSDPNGGLIGQVQVNPSNGAAAGISVDS